MPFKTLKKRVGDEIDDRLKDLLGVGDNPFGNAGPAGDFSFANTTYPYDLFEREEYGGNYAVFYISVAEDSRIFSGGDNFSTDAIGRLRGEISGSGITGDEIIQREGVAGAVLGSAIGAILGSGSGGGALGGALAAGSAKITQAQGVSFSRKQNTLKEAIALHVPNELEVQYQTDWGEETFFTMKALEGVMGEVKDAIQSGKEGGASGAIDSIKNGDSGGIAASTALNFNQSLGASVGLAANPRKEQIFNGVQARTFNMKYSFYPRNRKESNNVQNIIQAFKTHMMPEFLDEGSYIYVYPSEFDIRYMKYDPATGQTAENGNLFRHASCVLTDISVNYTPNGKFSTNEDSTPTACEVTLTFKELAIMDRATVMEGY